LLWPDRTFKSEWQGLLRYWARWCKNRGYWPTIRHVAYSMKAPLNDVKDLVAFLKSEGYIERHGEHAWRLSEKGWGAVPYEPIDERTLSTPRQRKLKAFATRLMREYGPDDAG